VHTDGKSPWAFRLRQTVAELERIIRTMAPAIVCIEKTQVNHGTMGAQGQDVDVKRSRSMAARTQQTGELVTMLAAAAARCGADVQLVHPATGLARLGCKRGCTDGAQSKAYNARFGGSLRASEHHTARAAGVALAALPTQVQEHYAPGSGSGAPEEAGQ
jgi:hypothetical protein